VLDENGNGVDGAVVKDAVVDQLRTPSGKRPGVSLRGATLRLALHLVGADVRAAAQACLRAVPLTVLTAATALLGAWSGRVWSWPPAAIVAGSILLVTTVGLSALWHFPRLALGADASWFAATARELLPARTPGLRRWIDRVERAVP